MAKPGRPRKLKSPGECPGRIGFLEKEIAKLRSLREDLIGVMTPKEGEKRSNDYLHQHVIAYSREIRETRNLLDVARADAKKVDEEKTGKTTRPTTQAERLAYDRDDAQACLLDDLEVYVEEWCRKMHLTLSVVEGVPILTREDASL